MAALPGVYIIHPREIVEGDSKTLDFVVHAAEKVPAFPKLESAIRKIALTLYLRRWQSRARVKSVGCLHRELHLTFFLQGQP